MKTFELQAQLNIRAVVPEQFTKSMRQQAQSADASPFLKAMQEKYPEDDEEFTLAILRNGLKSLLRNAVIDEFDRSGLGGSFAPPTIELAPDAKPALASEVHQAMPDLRHAIPA